jgi:hypothetical protein
MAHSLIALKLLCVRPTHTKAFAEPKALIRIRFVSSALALLSNLLNAAGDYIGLP